MTGLMLIALFGTAVVTASAMAAGMLLGGYLLRRAATPSRSIDTEGSSDPSVTTKIDIADLRTRLKRLEAIAAGVDL